MIIVLRLFKNHKILNEQLKNFLQIAILNKYLISICYLILKYFFRF